MSQSHARLRWTMSLTYSTQIDSYGSAKKSMFNIENKGTKTNIVNGAAVKPGAAKPKTFKTLADLGSE